jgi:hypothetical protein
MEYLRVRNFERYQHYKNRRPPWIKLYKDLWSDREFFALSEKNRYFLIGILIVASQNENRFPNDQQWLKRELATKKSIPIQELIDRKWLERSEVTTPIVLAECKQDASKMLVLPRVRDREEKEKENPPTPFKPSISKTEITSPGNLKIKHIHSDKCKDFGFCPEAIL